MKIVNCKVFRAQEVAESLAETLRGKNILISWSILSLIFLITSCDCVVHHKGFVLDSKSENPIVDATIVFDKREFKTDPSGYFEINYVTGFCPDIYFEVYKDGYKAQKLTIDFGGDDITYRIQSDNNNSYYIEENSLNFKVKSDTIYFYLTDNDIKGYPSTSPQL